jgi:iron-sulfur cluster assembly accessory protein
MLTLTQAAIAKVNAIIAEKNRTGLNLRIGVQGGGCSGFSYFFVLDEQQNDDDYVIPQGNFAVVIDAMSALYVRGSEIGYSEEFMASEFTVSNPKVQSTCSCGNSFSLPNWDI